MNVIEFHTWNSVEKRIDTPDRILFDLDPGEGTTWKEVQEAALLVRSLLAELGLASWLKTSGGKGLHVVVPITPKLDYPAVAQFSKDVVLHLVRVIPSRFVAVTGASRRLGKIFVDTLRNVHGATTAAAFSARARPGLGVSMPVSWDELAQLRSGAEWTIATAREHLSFQSVDPWADYWTMRQTLTEAKKILSAASKKR
jgi:bifunctional non-homologous end joining protein LigD